MGLRFATLVAAAGMLAACGSPDPGVGEPVRDPTPQEIAEAEAWLEKNNVPLPGGYAFERIGFAGDGFLRVGRASPEAPRATILFVPGYTSSQELASDFLARWYAMGFEVAGVDLPGQGGSMRRDDDPQKTYTGDFSFYGQAVARAAEHIQATRRSTGPLIVAGDSFGAHAILRAAHDGRLEEADGLFVMVPAIRPEIGFTPMALAKFMVGRAIEAGRGEAYLDGEGPWRPGHFDPADYEVCGDREDRNFKNEALYITRPFLRVGGISNEYALGMVTSGEELVRSRTLRGLDIPVTALTAGQDVIVENGPVRKLCGRMKTSCDLVEVREATHCLYLEDDATQARVHDALLGLIGRVEGRT